MFFSFVCSRYFVVFHFQRIVNDAENMAKEAQGLQVDTNYTYYNSKSMIEFGEKPPDNTSDNDLDDRSIKPTDFGPTYIKLTENPQFFNKRVNLTLSSVHVPTNVFDRSKEILLDIQWSEKLDKTFINNYNSDPTLSWQFFGSSKGFLRHFPGKYWHFGYRWDQFIDVLFSFFSFLIFISIQVGAQRRSSGLIRLSTAILVCGGGCQPQRYDHIGGHFRFNDRTKKRHCQTCCLKYT